MCRNIFLVPYSLTLPTSPSLHLEERHVQYVLKLVLGGPYKFPSPGTCAASSISPPTPHIHFRIPSRGGASRWGSRWGRAGTHPPRSPLPPTATLYGGRLLFLRRRADKEKLLGVKIKSLPIAAANDGGATTEVRVLVGLSAVTSSGHCPLRSLHPIPLSPHTQVHTRTVRSIEGTAA